MDDHRNQQEALRAYHAYELGKSERARRARLAIGWAVICATIVAALLFGLFWNG